MSKICNNCAQDLPDDAVVCNLCGETNIFSSAKTQPIQAAPQQSIPLQEMPQQQKTAALTQQQPFSPALQQYQQSPVYIPPQPVSSPPPQYQQQSYIPPQQMPSQAMPLYNSVPIQTSEPSANTMSFENIFCGKCGSKRDLNTRFCAGCGELFGNDINSFSPVNVNSPQEFSEEKSF